MSKIPYVIANLNPGMMAEFIAPALALRSDWRFRIERVDPEQGLEALTTALNANHAAALLIGWGSLKRPEALRDQAPNLRAIASCTGSVGGTVPRSLLENDGLGRPALIVTNWGHAIGRLVAEHCLFQILACLRQAAYYQIDMHLWQGWEGVSLNAEGPVGTRSLFGRRVGLHGFGHVAQALARLLAPFDCRGSAYAPHDPDEKFAAAGVTRCATLEALFAENEIVVELAPLIPETRGIVTWELLNRLPDGGVFVNSGRGAVVDEAALARLASQRRVNLALDVYTQEPLPVDSPLRGLTNVFLTPHIAGPTSDRRVDCGLYALENLQAYFENRPLKGVVDLWQYDHMT